jgi:hypothetical protein
MEWAGPPSERTTSIRRQLTFEIARMQVRSILPEFCSLCRRQPMVLDLELSFINLGPTTCILNDSKHRVQVFAPNSDRILDDMTAKRCSFSCSTFSVWNWLGDLERLTGRQAVSDRTVGDSRRYDKQKVSRTSQRVQFHFGYRSGMSEEHSLFSRAGNARKVDRRSVSKPPYTQPRTRLPYTIMSKINLMYKEMQFTLSEDIDHFCSDTSVE